ncbi:hypothetical protein BSKO_01193 [Bryopsis sp. KO-2023]|nr:hypothetical protein BSKO_01193 [Bryopsis sp. KO-2023]
MASNELSCENLLNTEAYHALCEVCGEEKTQALFHAGFSQQQIEAICSITTETRNSIDTLFIVLAAAIVFFMHAGFGMLCAGAIRTKNTMNILLQTVLDVCLAALCFYLLGNGLAFGTSDHNNSFIGTGGFAVVDPDEWGMWLLRWAFVATATTIPAGSVAERFSFVGYMGYTTFIGAWVYPLVAHWAWSEHGWLSPFNSKPFLGSGLIDFAGCTVVHMVGGLAGTMGAYIVGPRIGRFDRYGNPMAIRGHSATLVVLGTFVLWFGWYGFNPGSTATLVNEVDAMVMARTAVTTTLAGCAGAFVSLLWAKFRYGAWDLLAVCNGLLVGLVSITAGCSVVEPWAAIIAGSIGAILFDFSCILYLRLKIDDPLCAGPMHGVCGAWGGIFVGFLAKQEYVLQVYGGDESRSFGLLYGGGIQLFTCQMIGVVVVATWVIALMGAFFMILYSVKILRITADEELKGLDLSKHGGSAYYDITDRQGAGQPMLEDPGAERDETLDKING